MINMHDMQTSFLLCWAARLQQTDFANWQLIPRHYFEVLGSQLCCFKSTAKPKQFIGLTRVKSKFWQQVLKIWIENRYLFPVQKESIFDQCLWNNADIIFRKNVLCFDKWIEAGVNCVRDVWIDENIVSFEHICAIVGYSATRLFEYNALHTALCARALRDNTVKEDAGDEPPATCFQGVLNNPSPKKFRAILTQSKASEPCSVKFWSHKYNISIDEKYWVLASACTSEERLKLLQWKILHNIYPTNILLHKMKLKENSLCSLCNEMDYIEHFFWKCSKMKLFWESVRRCIFVNTGENIILTEKDVLFGYSPEVQTPTNKIINHILLISKMCISKYRYGRPIDINVMLGYELALRYFSIV